MPGEPPCLRARAQPHPEVSSPKRPVGKPRPADRSSQREPTGGPAHQNRPQWPCSAQKKALTIPVLRPMQSCCAPERSGGQVLHQSRGGLQSTEYQERLTAVVVRHMPLGPQSSSRSHSRAGRQVWVNVSQLRSGRAGAACVAGAGAHRAHVRLSREIAVGARRVERRLALLVAGALHGGLAAPAAAHALWSAFAVGVAVVALLGGRTPQAVRAAGAGPAG